MSEVPLAVLDALIVPQTGEQAAPFCVSVQLSPLFAPSFAYIGGKLLCLIHFNASRNWRKGDGNGEDRYLRLTPRAAVRN